MSSTGSTGLLLVISSPSGAGKTTLSRRLVAEHPELRFSVSYTTRPPRLPEVDGLDYHFVSDPTFDEMIARGEFAEWAYVHGRRYGTAIRAVREALKGPGGQVLFDIDYQGAESLYEQFPEEARLVYILPPSMAVLEDRLRRRGTDAPAVIERRLQKAREELLHHASYHYLILNDDIEIAYAELRAIYLVVRAERAGVPAADLPAQVVELARASERPRRAAWAEALIAQARERD